MPSWNPSLKTPSDEKGSVEPLTRFVRLVLEWERATVDNLKLDEPGLIVEPDVREEIKKYFVKMGLIEED